MFDPGDSPAAFWRREDVVRELADRQVGHVLALYLQAHPDCTQTRLATLTQHDRSDISNLVRGIRCSRVSDIDVLTRVADGLAMPDGARMLLGLAPRGAGVEPTVTYRASDDARGSWYQADGGRRPRITISGSRTPEVDGALLDDAVRALSTLLTRVDVRVDHGPLGVGVEVMTYIADHYRPPEFAEVVGVFGRTRVVEHADYVLVLGGGRGTLDEVDLALSMGKALVPYAATGGTAALAHARLVEDPTLTRHLSPAELAALGRRLPGYEYARTVERLVTSNPRSQPT